MINLTTFKLDTYTIYPSENSIENVHKNKVTLQPKVIQVLAYLAKSYPKLVSREELIKSVWNGNVFVGERGLTNAIWSLRHELHSEKIEFIKTVRKSGYLLLIEPKLFERKQSTKSIFEKSTEIDLNITRYIFSSAGVLSLALMSGLFLFNSSLIQSQKIDSRIKPSDIKLENLTTDPGRELFPDISPDKKYIVYTKQLLKSQTHLFVKSLLQPGLQAKQLTSGNYSESRPLWGEDSKSIYFVRKSRDFSLCEIVKMNIHHALEEVVASCPGTLNISLSLSSDKKTLAYTGQPNSETKSGIYLLDLTQPNKPSTRLSCGNECNHVDRDFSFSPDGRYMAITRRNDIMNEDVFLLDLQTQETTRLTFGESDILGITWHPDSKRLVYSSQNASKRDGYVITLHNKHVERLNIPGFSFPKFVPNTGSLVYHDLSTKTYVAFFQASKKNQAVPFPLIQSKYSHHSPHYSEANKKLVYVSNESGFSEVWSSNADGSIRKKLTELKMALISPRWSNDGKYIAFLGCEKSQRGNSLFILNVKEQSIRALNTPFEKHYRPTWSIDDKSLIVAAGHDKTKLFKMALDSNEIEVLSDSSSHFAIQSNDKKIWFTKGRYEGLWVVDPNKPKSKPRQVLKNKEFVVRYNWDVTDDGVFFQQDNIDNYSINFYDFATEKITSVIELPIRTLKRYSSMTYIPQEEKIVFTQSNYPQADIKRLEHPLLF